MAQNTNTEEPQETAVETAPSLELENIQSIDSLADALFKNEDVNERLIALVNDTIDGKIDELEIPDEDSLDSRVEEALSESVDNAVVEAVDDAIGNLYISRG